MSRFYGSLCGYKPKRDLFQEVIQIKCTFLYETYNKMTAEKTKSLVFWHRIQNKV